MATYILLLRFTAQGVGDVKESPARIEAARQAFRGLGAELKAFYMVLGQYDAVMIVEAPDDETAFAAAMGMFSMGASTQTLRAFTEDEFREIVAALP